jgi:hypothetical protein
VAIGCFDRTAYEHFQVPAVSVSRLTSAGRARFGEAEPLLQLLPVVTFMPGLDEYPLEQLPADDITSIPALAVVPLGQAAINGAMHADITIDIKMVFILFFLLFFIGGGTPEAGTFLSLVCHAICTADKTYDDTRTADRVHEPF